MATSILTVTSVAQTEGTTTHNRSLVFTLSLSAPSTETVRLSWLTTATGTANELDAYNGTEGNTFSIAAGQTSAVISVLLRADAVVEPDKPWLLTIYNLSGASFADGALRLTHLGVMQDDDGSGEKRALLVGPGELVEGDGGSKLMAFSVKLSRAALSSLSFDVQTIDGSAQAGADYTAVTQTLTFNTGQTEAVVLVPVLGDSVAEGEEFFTLRVTPQAGAVSSLAPVDAGGGSQTALGRIVDNDTSSTLPEVSVRSGLQKEDIGSSAGAYIYYQIVLSEPASSDVRLSWYHHGSGIARGAATDEDLHNGEQSNVITIPAGQTSYFLPLRLTWDTVDEIDESLMLEVYGLSGAVFAGGADRVRVLGVIQDDDGVGENRSLFVSSPELHEGTAGTRQAVFTVTLSRPSSSTLVFDYRTVDGTAQAGSDYDAATGTLSFAPGQTHASVAVNVRGDTQVESAERFALVVTPQPASASAVANGAETRVGMATLIDSDASSTLPEIQVVSVTQREGNSGEYPYLSFQLMLSEAPSSRVTVGFYIRKGSADFGDVHSGGGGVVTFEPGVNTGYASIRLNGDTTAENDESLVLELHNPVGAVFANGQERLRAVGFVLDEEGSAEKRTLFVSSPEVLEGASGTRQAVFMVQISRPASTDLVFDYRTMDGSAVAGSDYTAVTGSLTLIAGQTEAVVAVDVLGDTRVEAAERFTLLVTPQTASAAAIAGGANDRAGIATVVDEDASASLPEIHVLALTQREGNAGDYPYLEFLVALNEPATSRVTVGYYIRHGSTDLSDIHSGGGGTVTFEPGMTTGFASVRLNGDTTQESDESMVLELFNPVGAVFAGGTERLRAVGFVQDEDGTAEKRTLFVSSPEVTEGASGTRQAVFVVQLSRPASTDLVFDYRTLDGTAVAGSDYTAASGSLTFIAGQTEAAIAVDVLGDTRAEAAERFTLLVTPQVASAAAIAGSANDRAGIATLVDDDASASLPEVHVLALTQREGNSGDYPYLEFQVALSEAPTSRVTVRYDIFQRTANWTDVYSGGSGTLIFEAGQSTAWASIRMTGDTTIEPDEALVLELYNPVGAVLAGGVDRLRTTGFILDEEGGGEKRALIVADAELVEGAAGTQQMVFRVQLSRPANSELVFDFRTIDGSAVAGSDYTATSGSLTFAPGQTEAAVFVTVSGDAQAEAAETFTLLLTPQAGTAAALGNGVDGRAGLGTIIDDDGSSTLPEVSVSAFSIREGNSGDYPYLLFQLALSAAPTSRVQVPYFIRQETAFWPDVYSGGGGTVTFEAGETIAYASVRLTGDNNVEPDEAMVLELFNPSGAVFAGGAPRLRMSGFILDDDGSSEKRSLMVGDAELVEGASGTTQAAFRVQLSRPASTELVFSYRTVDGTARAGSDYTAATGTLSFAPGQTEATVFVAVSGDTFSEDAETFTLLVTPQADAAAAIGNGADGRSGVATVVDDDASTTLPELHVQALMQREGNSGDYPYLDLQLMLSQPPTSRVTLQFFAAHGTTSTVATVNLSDTYSGGSGTVTFEPGQTTAWAQIRLQGDNVVEADENYVFEFYNLSGAVMAGGAQRLHVPAFILDDDGSSEKRALLVRSVELREGGTGSRDAVFVVQLSRPATTELVFDYRTIDGTAIAGSDYTAALGSLSFAPGQTEATVHVPVLGDFDAEAEEVFSLLVTPQAGSASAIGNGLLGMQGLAWIGDDDISTTLPIASLRPARADEHTSTGLNFAFQVSLSEPTVLPARFSYAVVNGTTTSADFTGATSGSVTVAAGTSSQWVFIGINTDTLAETDESFAVEIFNPFGAVLAGGVDRLRASGIIVDDDGAGAKLALVVSEARVLEGNENNSTASFTLQLSRPSATPITFTYQTADGTAQAGVDYTATSGSVTFLPGQTFAAVNVPVLADLDIELDETFRLLLGSNPAVTNGTAAIEVLGTIRSDDPQNPPTGANDRYTAYAGLSLQTSASNGVLANDTDLEQHALTAQLMSPPTRGSLSLAADGSFTYTPQANFVGRDSFTYRPLDPFSSGVSATVWIDVRPASEAPGMSQLGAAAQVNTFATGLQYAPALAALSNGSFVAVWASRGQDGSGDGVFAQLLDANGAKLGSEFRVNTTTTGHQQAPAVAAAGSGFVVAWDSAGQDGSQDGIVARRFGNDGAARSAEFVVNTTTASWQVAPDVAGRADGSFIVAWQASQGDADADGVLAQRFDPSGARQSGEVLINSYTTGQQTAARVTALADGRAVLVWQSEGQDGSGIGVYARVLGATGVPGPEFRVNTTTASYQAQPDVVALTNGFAIAWASYDQDGSQYGTYVRVFNANQPDGGAEIRVNQSTVGWQKAPSITALSDGGFVVAYSSSVNGGTLARIDAQRFDANGAPLGGPISVSPAQAGYAENAAVATAVGGRTLMAWSAEGDIDAAVFSSRTLSVSLLGSHDVESQTQAGATTGPGPAPEQRAQATAEPPKPKVGVLAELESRAETAWEWLVEDILRSESHITTLIDSMAESQAFKKDTSFQIVVGGYSVTRALTLEILKVDPNAVSDDGAYRVIAQVIGEAGQSLLTDEIVDTIRFEQLPALVSRAASSAYQKSFAAIGVQDPAQVLAGLRSKLNTADFSAAIDQAVQRGQLALDLSGHIQTLKSAGSQLTARLADFDTQLANGFRDRFSLPPAAMDIVAEFKQSLGSSQFLQAVQRKFDLGDISAGVRGTLQDLSATALDLKGRIGSLDFDARLGELIDLGKISSGARTLLSDIGGKIAGLKKYFNWKTLAVDWGSDAVAMAVNYFNPGSKVGEYLQKGADVLDDFLNIVDGVVENALGALVLAGYTAIDEHVTFSQAFASTLETWRTNFLNSDNSIIRFFFPGKDPKDQIYSIGEALDDLKEAVADYLRDAWNKFGLGQRSIDPIILDLDGDGIELRALTNSTVRFDIDGDGFAERTAWVLADDGFLVFDRNGDGRVNDISELLGSIDIDGFTNLALYDTNRDGTIDASEPVFASLRVWRDIDQDGDTDPGELVTLPAAGITALRLAEQDVNYRVAGNLISAVSTFSASQGERLSADVWFEVDQLDATFDTGSTFSGAFTLDPSTLAMPFLRGYGRVPDLYVAMSIDPGLKAMLADMEALGPHQIRALRAATETLLMRWADADEVSPTSRGSYVDARMLVTIENFLGADYRTPQGGANPPTGRAGSFVHQAWTGLVDGVVKNLLVQLNPAGIFQDLAYDLATDKPILIGSLVDAVNRVALSAPTAPADAAEYWKLVTPVLESAAGDSGTGASQLAALIDAARAATPQPYTAEQARNTVVSSGLDGAVLAGSDRPELLLGSAADETFNGGQGGDSYLLGAARWGSDRILEVTSRSDETAEDVIVMPEGVLPNQVTISRSANGFVLQRRDSEDSLTVETVNLLGADGDFGVETIRFSNGVSWNVAAKLGAISANAGESVRIDEGQTLTRRVTITDPVDSGSPGWSWRVNWSDGQVVSGTMTDPNRHFDLTRTFPDSLAAPLEATITVTDDGSDVDVDRFSVSVLNVAPTLTASGAATVLAGANYLLQLAASDAAGVADPLTYSIDWDDGSPLQVLTAAQLSALGGQVAHVFPSAPGTSLQRTISVTVNDGDGGSATRTVAVQVTASGLTFNGTDGPDRMAARANDDAYFGGAGDDVIFPGAGADTIDGGPGYDLVSYEGSSPVVANLKLGTVVHAGRTDTLVNVEALFGSAGNDSLLGADNAAADVLRRGDTLRGALGRDTIDGGTGVDTAEFMGARAGYQVVRTGNTITVTDIDLSNGDEGTDTLLNIERLVFADQMLAFGDRADQLARVASVLWTPAIIPNTFLFARGFSFYDVGYTFEQMCSVALLFHPEQGLAFAQKLVSGSGSTTRSVADVMTIMANAGGGDAGRAAAVAVMAMDPAVTATMEAKGIATVGVDAALAVPGFGNLFGLFPG